MYFDVLRLIYETSDGGYIIAGEVYELRYSDILLIKFNSEWEGEWNMTLGGSLGEYAHTILQLEDGYIIAGNKWDYNKERHYAWMMKTDSEGNGEWNRTFGGPELDVFTSVKQTSDGFIIAGFKSSSGNGREDVWVIKTDSEGNEIWNRTYGGILEDAAYSIIQTSDGGYIIAGHTRSESHGIFPDAWLIKLSREKELTDKIPQNNNTSPSESDTESPGFEVFAFFFSMILTLILLRRKK